MKTLSLAVVGCGRIGRVHASNIVARIPAARLAGLADVNLAAAREIAGPSGVEQITDDYRELLGNPSIDAIVICSATSTHAQVIEEAAQAGKHIFCEKPIDLEPGRIRQALDAVEKAGVKLQIGFNRRFDPAFARLKEQVAAGKIGTPHIVRITSRDPAPPPIAYVRVSGGLPLDMMIHDFDMVRFLTGQEAVEIYATGSAMIDPEIGLAGDVDTCVATIRLSGGAIATIDNSRQAIYGYDQRVEVFGSAGLLMAGNPPAENDVLPDRSGVPSGRPPHFFLERYQESYLIEMREFVESVIHDRMPPVNGRDGLIPVIMGRAAIQSLREGQPVKLGTSGSAPDAFHQFTGTSIH